jgi:peptidoglycan/xylan/chitin deacetylase (PgdA/CDA1 family)
MRRLIAAALALLLLAGGAAAETAVEKYMGLPAVFAMEIVSDSRKIGDNVSYVYKEYLRTVNEDINALLAAQADAYDEKLSPLLTPDHNHRGNRNSRLNVDMVYYRTGEYFVSTLMLAAIQLYNEQTHIEITTGTYDLQTGEKLPLTEIFAADSPAWDILADGVRGQLETVFPDRERDESVIDALCTKEALEQADFTLSGAELTLHYYASALFEELNQLIHVRFFYPQFAGMMTELGARATDNSRWKMVAITCDDGPKERYSTYALDAFRKQGARVTYFSVGKMLMEYGFVLKRQFDQNHIFGCHTYHHWSGYSFTHQSSMLKELTMSDELTLKLVGEAARYFRAPGGTYPPWVEAGIPLPIIQWSMDTFDYTGKKPNLIAYGIRQNVREYDVILCHDSGIYLYDAVPIFGQWLTENGYMMVTLDELAAVQGVTPQATVVYDSFREDGARGE